jgi:hypothetical protein
MSVLGYQISKRRGAPFNCSSRVQHLLFFFLALSLLVNPWNKVIFLGLRLNDALLILAIAVYLATCFRDRLFFRFLSIIFLLYLWLLAALLISLLSGAEVKWERGIFIYKYTLIFVLPFLITKTLSSEVEITWLSKAVFYQYFFLVVWVFCYAYLLSLGVLQGVSRASFPGTDDYYISDAHLFSSHISIMLLGYVLFLRNKLNHGFIFSSVVVLLSLGALILTGSRNGLLALFFGLFFYVMASFLFRLDRLAISKKGAGSLLVALILIIFIAIFSSGYWVEAFNDLFGELLARATNFHLYSDVSSQNRFLKLSVAVNELQGLSKILGVGPFSATLDWYDGLVSIILSHFGFLGVFSLFIAFIFAVFKILTLASLRTAEGCAALAIFLSYVVVNLITEFSLITRSYLPAASLLLIVLLSRKLTDWRLMQS